MQTLSKRLTMSRMVVSGVNLVGATLIVAAALHAVVACDEAVRDIACRCSQVCIGLYGRLRVRGHRAEHSRSVPSSRTVGRGGSNQQCPVGEYEVSHS